MNRINKVWHINSYEHINVFIYSQDSIVQQLLTPTANIYKNLGHISSLIKFSI